MVKSVRIRLVRLLSIQRLVTGYQRLGQPDKQNDGRVDGDNHGEDKENDRDEVPSY